jgi:eukaryotic-like serine/threonine-protein kinase
LTGSDSKLERRVLDLFQVLLDLPEGERVAWVEAYSEIDSPLRTRLMAMLAGDRLANMRTGGVGDMIVDERLPERIGAYRITGLIGQGGMGAVYRGERMTGDFDHVAAIKLIRPGALSDALVERFQRERQTLASLSHPNIARLFDGGATDKGDPYIVMEYVDGVPLGTWIETGGASKAARTQLFLDICSAVGFAHQNLIVHRDITPSNILVAKDGTAKLIDFGIARPPVADTEAPPSAKKSLAGLSLTPGYAAPERVAGEAATTLSDVYSLGILLDRLVEKDADLTAIIAQASATEPADRYPSVDALADDVKAWRDSEVVAARNGGKRYAVGKFINRHRIGVGAGALAVLLLIGALVTTLIANTRAEIARVEAERRFGELRGLAGYMVFDLNDNLARTVGNATARKTLVSKAQVYLSALAATPDATADIKLEAARGLISLARIQGVPTGPNFGDHEQARQNLNGAIGQLNSTGMNAAAVGPDLATALTARAMIESHTDADPKKAKATLIAAEAALRRVVGGNQSDRWRIARSNLRIGQLDVAVIDHDLPGIGQLADQLGNEVDRWPAAERQSRDARTYRALADYYRSVQGYFTDDLARGVDFAQAAQRQFEKLDAEVPNDPNLLYQYLWVTYYGYGSASGLPEKTADADTFLQTTRRTIDRLIALEPSDRALLAFKGSLVAAEAQSLSSKGRYREAEAMQRSVVDLYTRSLGKERKVRQLNRLATAHFVLGNIGADGGNRELACAGYRDSRSVITELEAAGRAAASGAARIREFVDRNLQRCTRGAPLSEFEKESD